MAIPMIADPEKRRKIFPADRVNNPKASKSKEKSKSFSKPTILDTRGIKVENKEKQIKGMAVTSPTIVGVR